MWSVFPKVVDSDSDVFSKKKLLKAELYLCAQKYTNHLYPYGWIFHSECTHIISTHWG